MKDLKDFVTLILYEISNNDRILINSLSVFWIMATFIENNLIFEACENSANAE